MSLVRHVPIAAIPRLLSSKSTIVCNRGREAGAKESKFPPGPAKAVLVELVTKIGYLAPPGHHQRTPSTCANKRSTLDCTTCSMFSLQSTASQSMANQSMASQSMPSQCRANPSVPQNRLAAVDSREPRPLRAAAARICRAGSTPSALSPSGKTPSQVQCRAHPYDPLIDPLEPLDHYGSSGHWCARSAVLLRKTRFPSSCLL